MHHQVEGVTWLRAARAVGTSAVDLDAMDHVVTDPLPDRSRCITDYPPDAIYELRVESVAAADPPRVVVPLAGPGRWHLLGSVAVPAPRADWYIDAVNGSDSNAGDELAKPMKTHRELERRWGPQYVIDRSTTVHVLTDLPEVLAPDVYIAENGALLYDAELQETLYDGEFTASLQTSGIDEVSLSGVADWETGGPGGSSLIGYLIRDGVNDSVSWTSKKLTDPAKCRTSTSLIYGKALGTTASGAFTVGHPVTIERRAAVRGLNAGRINSADTRDTATYGTGCFRMYGFTFSAERPHNISFGSVAFPFFVACHFPDFVRWHRGHVWLESCRFSPTTGTASVTIGAGGYAKFNRLCANCNVRVEENGMAQINNVGLVQDGIIDVYTGATLYLTQVSVHNNPGTYAVRVRPGGNIIANLYQALTNGQSNGVTLWVEPGGLFSYPTGQPPDQPGSVLNEDFRLGPSLAAAQPWSALGAAGIFDTTYGAGILANEP